MLTSTQEVDNVIHTEDPNVSFGYTIQDGVVKFAVNIGIKLPCLFRERCGPNQ